MVDEGVEDPSVSWADVESASERLADVAQRTPVARSTTLDAATGARAFLKCENLQRAGAFKFRGAYNAISRLSEDERRRGVLAFSSGNHAQAVALASRLLGIRASIVMPSSAPGVKRAATEGYGARVIEYEAGREDREAVAERVRAETGATLIPPYDHPHIVAGQGTAARELIVDVGSLDMLLVPCGGGGLLSGSAISAAELSPSCRVIGAEPAGADDATRSFRTGVLQRCEHPDTIADGARTPSLGRVTFPIVRRLVSDMVTVTDDAPVEAMRFCWERAKLVVEPTGVLGLAALMSGAVEARDQRVGVILSGGNVDLAAALELLDTPRLPRS